uniref:Uncharacterized protein n=2 Tax=Oryza TaxID=4527 RepID=A0A0E0R0Q2_ORYRU
MATPAPTRAKQLSLLAIAAAAAAPPLLRLRRRLSPTLRNLFSSLLVSRGVHRVAACARIWARRSLAIGPRFLGPGAGWGDLGLG